MHEERRSFLKAGLGAGAIGVGVLLSAGTGMAQDAKPSASNGVVVGHSPKKEVLYKKTANWDRYYKATY